MLTVLSTHSNISLIDTVVDGVHHERIKNRKS